MLNGHGFVEKFVSACQIWSIKKETDGKHNVGIKHVIAHRDIHLFAQLSDGVYIHSMGQCSKGKIRLVRFLTFEQCDKCDELFLDFCLSTYYALAENGPTNKRLNDFRVKTPFIAYGSRDLDLISVRSYTKHVLLHTFSLSHVPSYCQSIVLGRISLRCDMPGGISNNKLLLCGKGHPVMFSR